MSSDLREWMAGLRPALIEHCRRLMCPGRFGLFRFSMDSKPEFMIQASAVCGGVYLIGAFGAWRQTPGWSPEAESELVAFVRSLQDPETGMFSDPTERYLRTPEDPARGARPFRATVTKFAVGYLERLGAAPLHPISYSGAGGAFDAGEYLRFLREGDWKRPWGTGSHAGLRTVELFKRVNDGAMDLVEVLCEGMDIILSHQNPETGMWGPGDIPAFEQISGTLKIVDRLVFQMGFAIPHLDRLTESIIQGHGSGAFYAAGSNACLPRNVAEVAIACIELGGERRPELLRVLEGCAERLRGCQTPDGSFADSYDFTGPLGWCGASVADASPAPRGSTQGLLVAVDSLAFIGKYLGWDDVFPVPEPISNWCEKTAKYPVRLCLDEGGRVRWREGR